MAKAKAQQRWRANTPRKRIEIYLPVDRIDELDVLASKRRESRAAIIAALIAGETPADEDITAPDSTLEPATPTPEHRYTFHRPREAAERRYKWIAECDDGTRIGLGDDPIRFYRWHGTILDGSLYVKDAKANSRDEVVSKLLNLL